MEKPTMSQRVGDLEKKFEYMCGQLKAIQFLWVPIVLELFIIIFRGK